MAESDSTEVKGVYYHGGEPPRSQRSGDAAAAPEESRGVGLCNYRLHALHDRLITKAGTRLIRCAEEQ